MKLGKTIGVRLPIEVEREVSEMAEADQLKAGTKIRQIVVSALSAPKK